jgi:ribonucleoside-diphosphate reductase alpha chain
LGIGYANLGALLMAIGVPYDSQEGFAIAGAITSLMTGASYRRSAEMAGVVGAYDGYAKNKAGHDRIMSKHEAASHELRAFGAVDAPIIEAANQQWALNTAIGAQNGWRNAQASLLAPTGTIGFMMDCDTTGIEPDFSLVKYKKLSTGGSMQIVNQTIPFALDRLGYSQETVEAIVDHISQHGHVVDAPGLKAEHYAIFDTAVGIRAIEPMGHVRMMAAVQPFLSGAISKTVNMPETATKEEIADVYFQGWKLGLKALAIYRDNCKVGQPLSDAKAKTETKAEAVEASAPLATPVRKRLPKSRPSQTTSFSVAGAEGYLTAGSYPDGGIGEVFIKLGKQGSTLAGVMDAFSIAVSIGLQYGVPLETYVKKFINVSFEPSGLTDDKEIRMAKSLMDYIFRRLALDFLPVETRTAMGIQTTDERSAALDTGSYPVVAAPAASDVAPVTEPVAAAAAPAVIEITAKVEKKEAHSSAELFELLQGKESDAPLCFNCGIKMRPSGSCHVCEGCGSTSGCS